MTYQYTYWQEPDGWLVGYWNDYPEHSTQGHDLAELQYMLRDLRKGLDSMAASGEIPPALKCKSDVMDI